MKKFLSIIVVILLAVSSRVSSHTLTDEEVLFWAAKNGDIRCVQILLDKNVSVNLFDAKGMTPLHIATMEGCERIVMVLLNAGSKLVKNNAGLTAVDLAKTPAIKQLIESRNLPVVDRRCCRKLISSFE